MKAIQLFQAGMLLATTLLTVGCANDDTAMKDGQQDGNISAGTTVFSGETNSTTRTAIVDHTKDAGANVNWAATDKVWVKDDASTWLQSGTATFPIAANRTKAMFTLNGTYTGATHDVIYTNLPIVGTPQVEIKAQQTQSAPNNFDHAGEAGDLGIATAVRQGDNNTYQFTLAHKSSYLCFLPRCMNVDLGKNIYLIKVTITADKPIAGTFNIVSGSIAGNAPAANSSNTITLATTNFPLNTTVADVSKNAAYMVIAPGTYNFTIGYTIKDPATNVEGTITKTLTAFTCDEGKIHDITAWTDKDIEDVTGTYHTWDAAVGENYWKGHDRDASGNFFPTLVNGGSTANYPASAIDSRWYNTAYGYATSNPATRSAANQPNVNLMAHYVEFGDPRWDANRIWSGYGHLYKGGIWLKRSTVPGFPNKSTDYWGVDYRTSTQLTIDPRADITYSNTTVPTKAEQATTYFFLPASGYYFQGTMVDFGSGGHYWTSTASSCEASNSWYLYFNNHEIHVRQWFRWLGSRIGKFY